MKSEIETKNDQTLHPFSKRFRSEEKEHLYRQQFLPQDRKQVVTVLFIIALLSLPFIITDYTLFGYNPAFYKLLAARVIFLIVELTIIFFVMKEKNEKIFDVYIFVAIMTLVSFEHYVEYSRPPDFSMYILLDLSLIMGIYAAFPNRVLYQLILALGFSFASVLRILITSSESSFISINAILVSLLFVNLVGYIISRRFHTTRRIQFDLWMDEKKLRNELQEAFENIKVLKGLLPICASCKKIRDDKGYWNQIETYIMEHTEADFSHGICPECAKKLYPEWVQRKTGSKPVPPNRDSS